jgi:hypothetical protein
MEKILCGEIVEISAVAMDDLSEKSLLDHIERHHLAATVTAVLKHHKGGAVSFIGVNESVAI